MFNKARARSPGSISPRARLLAAVAVLVAAPAQVLAQPAYTSVFDGYQSHRVQRAPIGWREANTTAAELGGFAGQTQASPRRADAPTENAAPPLSARHMGGMAEMMDKHRREGRR